MGKPIRLHLVTTFIVGCLVLSACSQEQAAQSLGVGGPDAMKITEELPAVSLEADLSIAESPIQGDDSSTYFDIIDALENSYLRYLPKEAGISRNFYSYGYTFFEGSYVAIDLSNSTLDRRLLLSYSNEGRTLRFTTAALYEPIVADEYSLISGDSILPLPTLSSYAVTSKGEWILR